MYTPLTPELVLEIENRFRAARSIGEFREAARLASESMYPTDSARDVAVRTFSDEYLAALSKAVGGDDFALEPIPDTFVLIQDHAEVVGTVTGLLLKTLTPEQQAEEVSNAQKYLAVDEAAHSEGR